ncbi:hypothetical protein FRC02_000348 [Tulasnella sp. 418]|nr:hypothetical protein FRC02_000348 [Tulasnella sp. 418]
MVNWMDPARIQADAAVFGKILFVMLGLYSWEVLLTSKFDWSILSRKRKFRYPMVFYFLCRFTLLFSLIGLNIAINTTTKMNCQALYTINQFLGNIAIATASTLLMLRAIAIWSRNLWVVVPLVILGLGQWGILLHGVVTVRASWSDQLGSCLVTGTLPVFLRLIYIYTMTYDFIVLLVSSTGLVKTSNRSDLWGLLFKDGIVYFAVAFIANVIPTTFLLLNLNPAMNIITTVPACVATTVVACRAFVRLSTFQRDVAQCLPSHATSSRPKTGAGLDRVSALDRARKVGEKSKSTDGSVHIALDSYSGPESSRGNSPYMHNKPPVNDDETSRASSDLEAGAISYTHSELARPPNTNGATLATPSSGARPGTASSSKKQSINPDFNFSQSGL